MPSALSEDLGSRVVAAALEGAKHRDAAERFGCSAASVSWWRVLERDQGDVRAPLAVTAGPGASRRTGG